MNKTRESRHMIDILFVLCLFCLFALSSTALILFGADIYEKTVDRMDSNYTARTSIAYLTEKIRQSDSAMTPVIQQEQDTTMLMLPCVIEDITYATSLYEYDGYLYELFARTDISLPLDAGQPIMELSDLSFTQVSPSVLKIAFLTPAADGSRCANTIYINTHYNKEADSYE